MNRAGIEPVTSVNPVSFILAIEVRGSTLLRYEIAKQWPDIRLVCLALLHILICACNTPLFSQIPSTDRLEHCVTGTGDCCVRLAPGTAVVLERSTRVA
jgi:hypothetical protein